MWDALSQIQNEGSLIDLRRESVDDRFLRGFVAATSADFVVFSLVGEQCHFDGACVLRMEDVTFLRRDTEVLSAWSRVLQESPSSPASVKHVDLSSWESVVRSVAGHEKVVSFHRERVDETSCYIGTNVKIDGDCLRADRISVEGRIDGQFTLRTGDLSTVDFGGGYEQALWRMVNSTG